jgi:hygromycin-B 7''-O-kinase
MNRPYFTSVKEYSTRFTDVEYWREFVGLVCERHQLAPIKEVRAGLAGTNPVFIVNERFAIKFYTNFFNGAHSFELELDLYRLIGSNSALPAPGLITYGNLYPEGTEWHWPYILTKVIPGMSLGEVREQVAYEDLEKLTSFLAHVLHGIHTLRVEQTISLPTGWNGFSAFIVEQQKNCIKNHKRWKTLPSHLISQLEEYLIPAAELLSAQNSPHLIHCDLNHDHVLGVFKGKRWQPKGIIDFGDVKVGDRLYEFVALHIGLFECDKNLLRRFVQAYGFDDELRDRFVLREMNYTLLHEFDVLRPVFEKHPHLSEIATLDELATWIWDMD